MVKRPAAASGNMAMNMGSWLPLALMTMMSGMGMVGSTLEQPEQKKKKTKKTTQLQESLPRETPAVNHDQPRPAECPAAPSITHRANGDSIVGPASSPVVRTVTLHDEVEEMRSSVDELILNQRFYETCHRRLVDFFTWSTLPRLGNLSTKN